MAKTTFDNTRLVTANGDIDHDYLRRSAHARAASQSETGKPERREVLIWEDKLLAMATMLRERHFRGVSEDTYRRLAVSSLVGHCESIAASGALPEPAEQSLRMLIAQTLSAFNMPTKTERVLEQA